MRLCVVLCCVLGNVHISHWIWGTRESYRNSANGVYGKTHDARIKSAHIRFSVSRCVRHVLRAVNENFKVCVCLFWQRTRMSIKIFSVLFKICSIWSDVMQALFHFPINGLRPKRQIRVAAAGIPVSVLDLCGYFCVCGKCVRSFSIQKTKSYAPTMRMNNVKN